MTGHEIIGKVVQVGSEVTEFKVGQVSVWLFFLYTCSPSRSRRSSQRVGIGAQSGSCGECSACKSDNGPLNRRSVGVSKADDVLAPQNNIAPSAPIRTTRRGPRPERSSRAVTLVRCIAEHADARANEPAHIRAQEQFVFDIPEALKSEDAASMWVSLLIIKFNRNSSRPDSGFVEV